MVFSSNIQTLRPSATIAVSTLAKKLKAEGQDIIDLSAGEPDFPTPEWISKGAIDGIKGGRTGYTPAPGLPELRTAVARDMERRSAAGWSVSAESVVVTSGAKQALFNACFALFGPGDEVVVATPYWTSYPEIVGLTGAKSVFAAGPREEGFKLGPEALDAVVGPSTKGLILCSPSNPTGAVYTRDELEAVARWARDRDIWLISDEIYRRIVFEEDQAAGLMDLDPDAVGPYVVVDGVSKCFAMTGWRIGYAVSEPEVTRKLSALQSHTTSNAATPSQIAALTALSEPERADESIREMVMAFRRRRDLVVRRFGEALPQMELVEPQGAFYLFIRVDSEYGGEVTDSQAWCSRELLERTGVALVPGVAFGDDRYVRLSYATSDALLEEAVRRLARSRAGGG
jgi:aspartate aminotransferase